MLRVAGRRSRGFKTTQGVIGDYYAGDGFSNAFNDYRSTQVVSDINYPTSSARPSNPATGGWSVRWKAGATPNHTQTYTFYLNLDGPGTLTVNGSLIINQSSLGNFEYSATVALTAGVPCDIQVEFYDDTIGGGFCVLSWSSASQSKQVIPSASFSILTPL